MCHRRKRLFTPIVRAVVRLGLVPIVVVLIDTWMVDVMTEVMMRWGVIRRHVGDGIVLLPPVGPVRLARGSR